jgi:ribosomal protein S18 acetylase RimI-like enzyme
VRDFHVRRIRVDEAAQVRRLRLDALADAPEAFVERHDRLAAESPQFWLEKAERGATSDQVTTFVAVEDDRHVGSATGLLFDASISAELVAMWVEPEARRRGLGRELAEAACAWARERGAASIELEVHLPNPPALSLYDRCGSAVVDGPRPREHDPSRLAVRMARALRPTAQ